VGDAAQTIPAAAKAAIRHNAFEKAVLSGK
jgi:hypothetical protein